MIEDRTPKERCPHVLTDKEKISSAGVSYTSDFIGGSGVYWNDAIN